MALIIHSADMSTISKIFCNSNLFHRKLTSLKTLKKWGVSGSKVRVQVSCRITDSGDRVLELDQSLMPYGLFSAPVTQGSRPSKEEEGKQDYYLNMGYAIRTLREEFPDLFYKELSFDIYRDDIVFKDPLNTFSGIENYKSIFRALRFHGRIFFKALCIDIVSVWQPVENTIMVRWTIHGVPRIPWECHGRFDGTSIYKLDREGKIFEHRVDNIALNSPPKFSVLGVEDLIKSLGCPSTPRPTYFEISSTSIIFFRENLVLQKLFKVLA